MYCFIKRYSSSDSLNFSSDVIQVFYNLDSLLNDCFMGSQFTSICAAFVVHSRQNKVKPWISGSRVTCPTTGLSSSNGNLLEEVHDKISTCRSITGDMMLFSKYHTLSLNILFLTPLQPHTKIHSESSGPSKCILFQLLFYGAFSELTELCEMLRQNHLK